MISWVVDSTNGNSKPWFFRVFRVFRVFRIAVPALPALPRPLAAHRPRKPWGRPKGPDHGGCWHCCNLVCCRSLFHLATLLRWAIETGSQQLRHTQKTPALAGLEARRNPGAPAGSPPGRHSAVLEARRNPRGPGGQPAGAPHHENPLHENPLHSARTLQKTPQHRPTGRPSPQLPPPWPSVVKLGQLLKIRTVAF